MGMVYVCSCHNESNFQSLCFKDIYLSRFFEIAFFLPLCVSSSLDAIEVATIRFLAPILVALTVATYIYL